MAVHYQSGSSQDITGTTVMTENSLAPSFGGALHFEKNVSTVNISEKRKVISSLSSTTVGGVGYLSITVANTTGLTTSDIHYIKATGDLEGTFKIAYWTGSKAVTTTPASPCFTDIISGFSSGNADMYEKPSTVTANKVAMTENTNIVSPYITNDGKFYSYQNFVYTDCWECFTGSPDSCDITSSGVVLWGDESDDQRIYANIANSIKSLDAGSSVLGTVGADNADNP